MNEHEYEPIRGLPGRLPQGEALLWQGAPVWTGLARRVFHVPLIGFYFLLLLIWQETTLMTGGGSLTEALRALLLVGALAFAATGLLALFAWLIARTTVYSITNRRIVIRFGVALSATVNIPFRIIDQAAIRGFADGTGDVPVTLTRDQHLSYLVMWPHVRPWRATPAQPMLRAVPEVDHVAQCLARALANAAEQPALPAPETNGRMRPVRSPSATAAA